MIALVPELHFASRVVVRRDGYDNSGDVVIRYTD